MKKKKFSVSVITVESKILSKNAEYWVMRSPMRFQGSGSQLQECSMKKIVVIELFIVATLGLHLGFSVKLRIWQVPACKMEPQSGYIMQLEPTTPPHQLEIFL